MSSLANVGKYTACSVICAAAFFFAMTLSAHEAQYEVQTRRDLRSAAANLTPIDEVMAPEPNMLSTGLDGYVVYALESNPSLRAAFERWRASVLSISSARKLPDPVLSYGAFLLNVETRVGPQRHRLRLAQTFPWPSRLTAGADAAAIAARAAQRQFESEVLGVRARVATAYWHLWQIREILRVQRSLLAIARSSADAVQSRVIIGEASLADLQQVDLFIARLEDRNSTLEVKEKTDSAMLVAEIGAPVDTPTPTAKWIGEIGVPDENIEALIKATRDHPRLRSFALRADGSEAEARSREAARYPNITLALDWIEVGETAMPDVSDSGRDALIFGVGMSLPLWQGATKESAASARSQAAAFRADGKAAENRAIAELTRAVTAVRDAARRISLHRTTLIPQAKAIYDAVVADYTIGRSSVGDILMAARNLLEVQIGLIRSQSDSAVGQATLDMTVGRPVRMRAFSKEKQNGT
ncbi:MAG: TolC family protein [Myxococcota bacterium]|nr:TolC family protein [Myxococcota bacterium]